MLVMENGRRSWFLELFIRVAPIAAERENGDDARRNGWIGYSLDLQGIRFDALRFALIVNIRGYCYSWSYGSSSDYVYYQYHFAGSVGALE